jgi:hypothetical protein
MSLVDRTNEEISLSLHMPTTYEATEEWEAGEDAASVYIDADRDSSFTPSEWVCMSFTDFSHDSDTFRLTYEEAELVWERLGLVLGKGLGK